MLTIGALARASGIAIATLRAWERRYGYPIPVRKPSGHRVYPLASVPRLRRIAEALQKGLRAGEVVPATDTTLARLLDRLPRVTRAEAPPAPDPVSVGDLLQSVRALDRATLTSVLHREAERRPLLDLLHELIGPLLVRVGEEWEAGRLQIRHEHLCSACVGDLLRALRARHDAQASGPVVLATTLPGERHELGLQMASLVLSAAGCRVWVLGTEVPAEEVLQSTRELAPRAVVLSVAEGALGAVEQVTALRQRLPKRVDLWVGGHGAPRGVPGVVRVSDLLALDEIGRRIGAA